jgi:phage tail sheath protein FI
MNNRSPSQGETNMSSYKTPGVYVEEVSTLPPSVAEVSTAIPAFLGYTQKGPPVARVSTMLDFELLFGKPTRTPFEITVLADPATGVKIAPKTAQKSSLLYYAVSHYFKNGGGPCYIFSLGPLKTTVAIADFEHALDKLELEDEPTLIVLTDAVLLPLTEYCSVAQAALWQCERLRDRFLILDVPEGRVDEFREHIGINNLSYAAAYYPYLRTSISYDYSATVQPLLTNYSSKLPGITISYTGSKTAKPRLLITDVMFTVTFDEPLLTISYTDKKSGAEISAAWKAWMGAKGSFEITDKNHGTDPVDPTEGVLVADSSALKGIDVTCPGSKQARLKITQEAAFTVTPGQPMLTISNVAVKTGRDIVMAWTDWKEKGGDPEGFDIRRSGSGSASLTDTVSSGEPLTNRTGSFPGLGNGITVSYTGSETATPKLKIVSVQRDRPSFEVSAGEPLLTSYTSGKTGEEIFRAWNDWKGSHARRGFEIEREGEGVSPVEKMTQVTALGPPTTAARSLDYVKENETALYNQIKEAMTRQYVTLPPSAAMAGIYASVDRDRGVWKAPANVSVAAVISAASKITDAIQEGLNVDPTAGKSINAIRDFTGKGTLVWGARTLAGNDNEWRYVSVRRLFITIEENAKKASAFAVFEPNDATTWLKVRGMLESYLYSLWERGALAGPTPESAYYVHVGLGTTMTVQDVLEGRMIVEIGIAAVRPAEFIVLRFMHKLQEA